MLDWNCGTRAKDFSGGNHAGTDIMLWPFGWNMMAANQGEIVAAAPGIIIAKIDGQPNMNCLSTPTNDWNTVYVQHSDGTIAWYGHIKEHANQQTRGRQRGYRRVSGQRRQFRRAALHFEVHDAQGNILDSCHGSCNAAANLWTTHKPYNEPTINALLTHTAPPVFNNCLQLGQYKCWQQLSGQQPALLRRLLHHDQQQGQMTTYTIYGLDNSVFQPWMHTRPGSHLQSY
ncbi:MAG: hypothetical protein EOO63_08940 [Hymenobacter sp.]|nr:MAG: hypothetical protein EOO63_08940 [Hymenobacter sp.]